MNWECEYVSGRLEEQMDRMEECLDVLVGGIKIDMEL